MIEQSVAGGVCDRHSMNSADKRLLVPRKASPPHTHNVLYIQPVSRHNSPVIRHSFYLRALASEGYTGRVILWVMKRAFRNRFAGCVYYGLHTEDSIHIQTPIHYHTCLCTEARQSPCRHICSHVSTFNKCKQPSLQLDPLQLMSSRMHTVMLSDAWLPLKFLPGSSSWKHFCYFRSSPFQNTEQKTIHFCFFAFLMSSVSDVTSKWSQGPCQKWKKSAELLVFSGSSATGCACAPESNGCKQL